MSSVRENLILAGIAEINAHGTDGFSMRRVAAACGVSCAAPYKHFKDRKDYIAAMIQYINQRWDSIQREILQQGDSDLQQLLVRISMAYVRFLVDNPQFRSIILSSDPEFDRSYPGFRRHLSELTHELVLRYSVEAHLTPEATHRKTYIVRSLIYGAALLMDSGELEHSEESYSIVEESIRREFALP